MEDHELAAVFPLMSSDEFTGLVEDVKENGLYDAIVLYEGKILDGRNRYRACLDAGVEPRFVAYGDTADYDEYEVTDTLDDPTTRPLVFIGDQPADYLGDLEDPLTFVVSHNLKRRHLNDSQRAWVGANIATMKFGDNQYNREGAPIGAPSVSQSEAAEMMQVSRRSVQRATIIKDRGAPELQQAVARGEVSIHSAEVVATLPEAVQVEAVESMTVPQKASEVLGLKQPSDDIPYRNGAANGKASKTYEITTKRKQDIANKAHERFSMVIAGLDGYCLGMKDFDLRPAVAVASEDEIAGWMETLTEVSRMARTIKAQLEAR